MGLNLEQIVFFDNNGISIDGSTDLTCSDNQTQRFKASNWATIEIDGHDYKQIDKAIKMAIKSDKPTLISCKTIIGYGSPNKSGKSSCHGSPLGKSESEITKMRETFHRKQEEIEEQNRIADLKEEEEKLKEIEIVEI